MMRPRSRLTRFLYTTALALPLYLSAGCESIVGYKFEKGAFSEAMDLAEIVLADTDTNPDRTISVEEVRRAKKDYTRARKIMDIIDKLEDALGQKIEASLGALRKYYPIETEKPSE